MKIRNYAFNPYLVISVFGFLVYVRALFFGFTYLDDNVLILDNLFFLQNAANVFKIFTLEVFHVLHASAAYYRPILTLSFMIDSWFSGPSPFVYHLTNILIHLASSCALFVLLQKLKITKDLSLVFSLIFAIHPSLAQAVAWIPGRNDSLIALFFFLCFSFYIKYWEENRGKFLFWHFIFFFLALFTKESAIFIPVAIVYYSLILEKKKLLSNINIVIYIFWFVIFSVWYFLRNIALSSNPVNYVSSDAIVSIIKNVPATLLFLGKAFLPINLSTLPTLSDSTLIYGTICLVVILIMLIMSKPNIKILFFGVLVYLIFLVPSFVRPNNDYVADFLEHRQYLPMFGLLIVLSQIKFITHFDLNKKVYLYTTLTILIVFTIINFLHLGSFENGKTYWTNAVTTSPSHPLAHKNLGSMYFFEQNYQVAEMAYLKSLELNPNETMSHNNLGLIYLYQDNFEKSEAEFNKELEINPNYDNTHFNLGLLYYRTNKKQKAEEMWIKTISINNDYRDAYKALVIYYSEIKDNNKSGYYLNEAAKRGIEF